jgi:hypothetical protein
MADMTARNGQKKGPYLEFMPAAAFFRIAPTPSIPAETPVAIEAVESRGPGRITGAI